MTNSKRALPVAKKLIDNRTELYPPLDFSFHNAQKIEGFFLNENRKKNRRFFFDFSRCFSARASSSFGFAGTRERIRKISFFRHQFESQHAEWTFDKFTGAFTRNSLSTWSIVDARSFVQHVHRNSIGQTDFLSFFFQSNFFFALFFRPSHIFHRWNIFISTKIFSPTSTKFRNWFLCKILNI